MLPTLNKLRVKVLIMSNANVNKVTSESLVKDSKSVMEGLNDLVSLMSDEDRGAQYIKRLSKEMNQLWSDILKFHYSESDN